MASTLSNGNDRLREGNRRRHRGFMVSCDRKRRFSIDTGDVQRINVFDGEVYEVSSTN